jgi:enoyl-CoA hydratase
VGEVRIEQRDRVLLATLDNPPHALMDAGTVDGLATLIQRAESDDSVGAVVLTGGHPDRFVAHYDVEELLQAARGGATVGRRAASASLRAVGALRRVPAVEEAMAGTPLGGLVALERFHEILLRMNRCGAVFVAALNGSAMGGGSELALACDVRIMAEGDHCIAQPEILLAFPPGGGGTQRLARLLGSARALRIVLDGGPASPRQALEIGLVEELVPAAELVDRAVALAARLGTRTKNVVAACKRAVYEGGSLPLPQGLHVERAEFVSTFGAPEADTEMVAYLEALERSGELPLYDPAARADALERGRFSSSEG